MTTKKASKVLLILYVFESSHSIHQTYETSP